MENKRKQEILGISFIIISICLMVSLFFYNPVLSPTISKAAEKSNPFGLLGIYFNFYAMKYVGIGIYFLLIVPLFSGFLLLLIYNMFPFLMLLSGIFFFLESSLHR